MPLTKLLCLALATHACAQSINGLGVSGGNGSRGGIGSGDRPVRHAQAFITDGLIPSTPNSTRQLAEGPAPVTSRSNASAGCGRRVVIVDSSPAGRRQEMVGFGHAWTDSTVDVFNTLEPDVLDQVMQDLFGQDGNNMGFMRHTIGSSDLSGRQYSYDDNGPGFNLGEPDPMLTNFSLGPDGTAMAKMIARMGQYKGDVFLFGSPWSYPGWMKNNDLLIAPVIQKDGGQYPLLNNSLNIKYIPQAVEYFTKYIDAFRDLGVTVNGLTLENEPLNYQGKSCGYPCMYLDAADEAAVINQGLGAALKERGILFMAYDHNTDQPVYPYRVLQGISGSGVAQAVAWHCYQGPAPNYTVLNDISRLYPGTLQFMSECSTYLPAAGSVNFGVAQNFIPPVQHGASGASMWVMGTDPDFGPHSPYGGCAGCLGSIIVNSSTTYTKTHDYYMIGQFSRFVRRGGVNYQVLQGNEGNALSSNQLYIMAVQNPDRSWAVIFMNNLQSDQEVVLSFSAEHGQFWEGIVPKMTVTTWLIPSQQILSQTNGTQAASMAPPYPFGNGSMIHPTGSGIVTGTGFSACSVTSTSSSSSSSSGSETVLPVPNTSHTIATAGGA
ncbi:hypothetical protein LTR56_023279 [Elasticomyces elasticus]|nr:hypothetical protein LTR56_023279 [Elasticomyces elasticus]KAK3627323.1 hypothetical protein LTR22_022803 [Elasticomyces elasticus]KAK4907592.1 hypothetical protein LTR49_023403 [Elasticomyces elasticus]KAK5766222.1 hypothetical protein LTS12_003706 [Elasticomyces elasticus]